MMTADNQRDCQRIWGFIVDDLRARTETNDARSYFSTALIKSKVLTVLAGHIGQKVGQEHFLNVGNDDFHSLMI